MAVEIQVFAPEVEEPSNVSIRRSLFWFDPFYRKLHQMTGSSLKYIYVEEEYIEMQDGSRIPKGEATEEQLRLYRVKRQNRMKAEPASFQMVIKTKKQDLDQVKSWFGTYTNYNHTDASLVSSNGSYVVFSVPTKEVDAFTYDLERNNIRFNVQ